MLSKYSSDRKRGLGNRRKKREMQRKSESHSNHWNETNVFFWKRPINLLHSMAEVITVVLRDMFKIISQPNWNRSPNELIRQKRWWITAIHSVIWKDRNAKNRNGFSYLWRGFHEGKKIHNWLLFVLIIQFFFWLVGGTFGCMSGVTGLRDEGRLNRCLCVKQRKTQAVLIHTTNLHRRKEFWLTCKAHSACDTHAVPS